MPSLIQPESPAAPEVEFIVSTPLDLINSMCFTALAGQLEGLPEWPVRTRQAMNPGLRDELDLFFAFPGTEWGVLGQLSDMLFLHPEAWGGIDALLDLLRSLPPGGVEFPDAGADTIPADFLRAPQMGIQGLALASLHCSNAQFAGMGRDGLASAAQAAGRDVRAAMALYDDPEQVRARLIRLIRRFYDEHYRPDEARRVACMERTAAAHNGRPVRDVEALLTELTHHARSCVKEAPAAYTRYLFLPSLDVGPYSSCADFPPYHGLFYPCEPEHAGIAPADDDAQRIALVYRALSDEQRLRILHELRDGELYVNEIVARTGLHQSVASRHLSFLKVVGLVNSRRQNNMKFFSLNRDMRHELSRALDVVMPPAPQQRGASRDRGRSRTYVE